MSSRTPKLASCTCCGLVQHVPRHRIGQRLICSRCKTPLKLGGASRNHIAAALAASALAFYAPAMILPMLRIEQLGHFKEDSLVAGVMTLLREGYWFVGLIVLLFSIVLPPLKLLAILVLSRPALLARSEHRAQIYHAVEKLGKWGMLDVMLVAIMVAYIKLGDLVKIHAGSGLIAFAVLVLLSLLSGLLFNPRKMWNDPERA